MRSVVTRKNLSPCCLKASARADNQSCRQVRACCFSGAGNQHSTTITHSKIAASVFLPVEPTFSLPRQVMATLLSSGGNTPTLSASPVSSIQSPSSLAHSTATLTAMETLSLPPSLPAPLQRAHIAHISNLDPAQSARILARIIEASKLPSAVDEQHTAEQVEAADRERAALDFAFLDPTRLCSKQHLISAILQAALISARSWNPESGAFVEGSATAREGGMKTKTPHSEIIYMLNPGNNVGTLCLAVHTVLLLTSASPLARFRWESH